MRPVPNCTVANHSCRTTGEKWRVHFPDAAEFGLSARQSLGLSVITIEGSTTKKLIEVKRLLEPVAPPLFWRGVHGYNDERVVCQNRLKKHLCYRAMRLRVVIHWPIQKTFSLDSYCHNESCYDSSTKVLTRALTIVLSAVETFGWHHRTHCRKRFWRQAVGAK